MATKAMVFQGNPNSFSATTSTSQKISLPRLFINLNIFISTLRDLNFNYSSAHSETHCATQTRFLSCGSISSFTKILKCRFAIHAESTSVFYLSSKSYNSLFTILFAYIIFRNPNMFCLHLFKLRQHN